MTSQQIQDESSGKLIRLHQYKISQTTARIAKVREGFEGGIYDLSEAKAKIAEHRSALSMAEEEVSRLRVVYMPYSTPRRRLLLMRPNGPCS